MVEEHIEYFREKGQIDKLNVLDENGLAPIHYAAKFNNFEIMKTLIKCK